VFEGRWTFTEEIIMCSRFDFYPIHTISDVVHNLNTFIRIPVQMILSFIEDETPKLGYFFEISCSTGTGSVSFIVSLFLWFIFFGGLFKLVEELDQKTGNNH
jgi:hypothetical protein